jgi:hypothetical protein
VRRVDGVWRGVSGSGVVVFAIGCGWVMSCKILSLCRQ